MSVLTRRTLLAGTTGLLGASALGGLPTAHAEAPPAAKQVPSAYRYKVGKVEVTVIADEAVSGRFCNVLVSSTKTCGTPVS